MRKRRLNSLRLVFLIVAIVIMSGRQVVAASPDPPPMRGLEEVDHSQVELRGGFWGPRLKTHHEVTTSHALNCLEKDGHVTNFDKAAGVFDGPLKGHHAFDSDLHKALEGAMYSLRHYNDSQLRQRVEGILDRILAAQQKDGFLISCWIAEGLDKKWDDLRLQHQMYNAGHFFEMAVAHYQLTGNPKALNAARRFADHIDSVFGPGKRYDVDGHQEVELALVKLYRATGERRYLELSRFFLDERGYAHGTDRKPFDPKTAVMPPKPEGPQTDEQRRANRQAIYRVRNGRMQDHKPVVEQFEAVGHAVRAGYMYAAMTDIVRFMNAPDYERALDHLWNDVVSRKMYITGAVGTGQYGDEGFGDPYLLPNRSAYCESCAAIAHVLWQHRMNLLKGQAKYADMMELTLYNGMLSGISISGDRFFYQNPLASKGAQRSSWIGLSCCPTNLARIIPQIGGLAYARGKRQAYVNLYVAGEASFKIDDGVTVTMAQQTDYPWDGRVQLTVTPSQNSEFDLCLRIPGWAQGRPVPSDLYRFADSTTPPIGLKVNGQIANPAPRDDGYVHIQRRWKAGDVVELDLPMPIHRVHPHEKIQDDQGKVALMRGPIIYCLEAADNPDIDLSRLTLSRDTDLRAEHRAGLLGGITVLQGKVLADGQNSIILTAMPYYAWANRAQGAMTVWCNETPTAAPPSTK
ncbi:MAG: glycoside hydrolase family 127 protein [Candidatus Sumerlaeota bacterium]|nr:glycoside hydrolase family 127 protein [Candidatus Sumerlaeota bacterium]